MKNYGWGQLSYICKQALATIASGLIPLYGGMTYGMTTMILPKLREDSTLNYDPKNDSWIASISGISTIIGSLSCGAILDASGRKVAHIIAGIPAILGWTLIACSNSTASILAGRFATGLSISAIKIVTMVYVGEVTDPKFRPIALFLLTIMGNVGVLASHLIGYYLDWKVSAAVCVTPAVISVVSGFLLKESPLWLIAKGRVDDGTEHFRWFRGTSEPSEMELKLVLERQTEISKIGLKTTIKTACKMSFVKPTLVLMVLMLNSQLLSMNAVVLYSQNIFQRTFGGKIDPFLLLIVTDIVIAVLALIFCALGSIIPKKKVILACNFLVTVFTSGLVIALHFLKLDRYLWVHAACLVMYLGCAYLVLTLGWTFVPELLPNSARGFGSGVIATFAFIIRFIVIKETPDMMNTFGEPAMFVAYGLSAFFFGFILIFILPETHLKTLQSIEDNYVNNKDESTAV